MREILCALRIELLAITFHVDFILRYFKWHFPLCFANWTEEARVKQRVAYGFSSLLLALEIRLPLRALELGNAWTAIIMDTRNGEDCYPLSGQRLWCDFTVKLLRRLPVLWQWNCHGNGFKGLTLRFDSRQEPSMTLVLDAVHFEVMCEKNVPLPWTLNFGLTKTGKELQAMGWWLIHSRYLATWCQLE